MGKLTHAEWATWLPDLQPRKHEIHLFPTVQRACGTACKEDLSPLGAQGRLLEGGASEPSPRAQPDKCGKYLGVKQRMMQEGY